MLREVFLVAVQLPLLYTLLLALSSLVLLIVLAPSRLDVAAMRRKATLYAYGMLYVTLSRDCTFKLPPDPGKTSLGASSKKRIVFVRHGESCWNECFNRTWDLSFPWRLASAFWKEVTLLLCLDSVFVDSPLSQEGIAQARKLDRFLESDEGEELRRLCESAVFTCSTLRRAASTALVGFNRFLGNSRPVWVLSCLQEISRNVDTLALAAPYSVPWLSGQGADHGRNATPVASLQAAFNAGNKGLASHGAHRLEAFCDWVFSPCGPAAMQPNIIVSGHSLWFKTFFQAYMPHTSYHACKHDKIMNCGVIAFDLELIQYAAGGPVEYRIVPESVSTLYGGFEKAKSHAPKATKSDKID